MDSVTELFDGQKNKEWAEAAAGDAKVECPATPSAGLSYMKSLGTNDLQRASETCVLPVKGKPPV